MLKWTEPRRFNRKRAFLFMRALELKRVVVLGTALAVLFHGLAVALMGPLRLPIGQIVAYYSISLLFVPALLVIIVGVFSIVPETVRVKSDRIVNSKPILGAAVKRWQFADLKNEHGDVVLRLWYVNQNGRNQKASFGLCPKVDIQELDRALRRVQRLGRYRQQIRKRGNDDQLHPAAQRIDHTSA